MGGKSLSLDQLLLPQDNIPELKPYLPVYVGLSAIHAKEAPAKGVRLYFFQDGLIPIACLNPGFFAAQSAKIGNWGIVKINPAYLSVSNFLPFYLKNMSIERKVNSRRLWCKSLASFGAFLYSANIPPSAILRVMTFDPTSNDFVTNFLLENGVSNKHSQVVKHRLKLLSSWLMAENTNVLLDWFPDVEDEFDIDPQVRVATMKSLGNQFGLELFFKN
jgi:hypothetical protein